MKVIVRSIKGTFPFKQKFSCKAKLLPKCESQDLLIEASWSIIFEQALKTDR